MKNCANRITVVSTYHSFGGDAKRETNVGQKERIVSRFLFFDFFFVLFVWLYFRSTVRPYTTRANVCFCHVFPMSHIIYIYINHDGANFIALCC